MSTNTDPAITHDLMALHAHVQIQPHLVPGNLTAIIGWNAIRELFLVSWSRQVPLMLDAEPLLSDECPLMGAC